MNKKYHVLVLNNDKIARQIGLFLTEKNTFDQTWAPNEKKLVKKAVFDSIKNSNHQYWYILDGKQIIAAAGVRENKYKSGGYEMDADYIAVHRNYRRSGLASLLLSAIENFVKRHKGRYLHILTCDIDSYLPARKFYEKHGYKKVSNIPDYYVPHEGRIDYIKYF